MSAHAIARFVVLGIGALVASPVYAESARVEGVYFLKVRTAPNWDAPDRAVLEAGDVVEIVGQSGIWAEIELGDGTRGYASKKYLTRIGTASPDDTSRADRRSEPSPPSIPGAQGPPAIGAPEESAAGTTAPRASDTRPVPSSGTPMVARIQAPACSKADIEALRSQLRDVAEGQQRLVSMATRPGAAPGDGTWSALPGGETLPLLGAGCVIGWCAARIVGRRRRNRIRI
jgi:hypothetical protein